MGKPGAKAMNIFQNEGIQNNPEKGRYSDPSIPGMGSPYNKRGCKSSYNQTGPQIAAFGPKSKLAKQDPEQADKILTGIVNSPNSQVMPAVGPNRGLNRSILNDNNKPSGYGIKSTTRPKSKIGPKMDEDCDCPKDLDNCNCE